MHCLDIHPDAASKGYLPCSSFRNRGFYPLTYDLLAITLQRPGNIVEPSAFKGFPKIDIEIWWLEVVVETQPIYVLCPAENLKQWLVVFPFSVRGQAHNLVFVLVGLHTQEQCQMSIESSDHEIVGTM